MIKLSDKTKLSIAKQALEEISTMVEPENCSNAAEEAGLDDIEFIEMAYENAIWTAQRALRQMEEEVEKR